MLVSVYLTSLGDLLKEIKVNYQLYADDTLLYFECSSKHIFNANSVELTIQKVLYWFANAGLQVNESKTEAILISSVKNAPSISSINVGNVKVKLSNSLKCLGVTVDTLKYFCFEIILFVYNCPFHKELIPDYLAVFEQRAKTSRNGVVLVVPKRSSTLGRDAFDYQGAVLWNKLLKWIRVQNGVDQFKSALKPFLFREHFTPNTEQYTSESDERSVWTNDDADDDDDDDISYKNAPYMFSNVYWIWFYFRRNVIELRESWRSGIKI